MKIFHVSSLAERERGKTPEFPHYLKTFAVKTRQRTWPWLVSVGKKRYGLGQLITFSYALFSTC